MNTEATKHYFCLPLLPPSADTTYDVIAHFPFSLSSLGRPCFSTGKTSVRPETLARTSSTGLAQNTRTASENERMEGARKRAAFAGPLRSQTKRATRSKRKTKIGQIARTLFLPKRVITQNRKAPRPRLPQMLEFIRRRRAPYDAV